MPEDVVHFEVNYGGKFYMSPKKEVSYRRGKVHHMRGFLCDEVSRVVLTQILEDEICGIKVRELWYAIPGMKLDNGLVRIDSDLIALDMLTKRRSNDSVLDLYLIQKNEIGPSELKGLKSLDPLQELPSTDICQAGDRAGDECQASDEHIRNEAGLGEEGVGVEEASDEGDAFENELDDDEPDLSDDGPELWEPEVGNNDPIRNIDDEPQLGNQLAYEDLFDDILVSDFDTLSEKDLDDVGDFSSLDESEEEEKPQKRFVKFTPAVNQGTEIKFGKVPGRPKKMGPSQHGSIPSSSKQSESRLVNIEVLSNDI